METNIQNGKVDIEQTRNVLFRCNLVVIRVAIHEKNIGMLLCQPVFKQRASYIRKTKCIVSKTNE